MAASDVLSCKVLAYDTNRRLLFLTTDVRYRTFFRPEKSHFSGLFLYIFPAETFTFFRLWAIL